MLQLNQTPKNTCMRLKRPTLYTTHGVLRTWARVKEALARKRWRGWWIGSGSKPLVSRRGPGTYPNHHWTSPIRRKLSFGRPFGLLLASYLQDTCCCCVLFLDFSGVSRVKSKPRGAERWAVTFRFTGGEESQPGVTCVSFICAFN